MLEAFVGPALVACVFLAGAICGAVAMAVVLTGDDDLEM